MSTGGDANTYVNGPRAHVLVAVKDLRAAKTRLSGFVGGSVRTDLVLSMLHDTLSVVRSVDTVAGITVVTPDDVVAELARSTGADAYPDPAPPSAHRDGVEMRPDEPEVGLNSALSAAADHVRRLDPSTDLVALQADLPSIRVHELTTALAAAREHSRSMIVDRHGTGTAALFACDSDADLGPSFGPSSARRHLESGARPLTGDWPGLRTDVDTESDLAAATELGVGPSTAEVLAGLALRTGSANFRA
ncbi:2-phospho-L-lactate guanylyltransferase [Rhodococcus sp. NPDC058521]|uniref:2-phospho-L-lactate guanylyltransferase n=1 Tax=Rhodococcus sp. NPDC058521 TaxID=3346536 RepID=UPI00364EA2A2